jgi:hypothetical protein
LEIALQRRTPIKALVWDGRRDTFHTIQGHQKIEMLSDSIIKAKTLETVVAYDDFLLTRNQKSWCLSNLKLDMSYLCKAWRHCPTKARKRPCT